jgi:trk system potassium uptake protein TrkA
MRRLFPETSVEEWTDATGRLGLVERSLPEAWAGRQLTLLSDDDRFRVLAVTRAGQIRLVTPDMVGQEGDVLHIAVRKEAMDELDSLLYPPAGHATGGH